MNGKTAEEEQQKSKKKTIPSNCVFWLFFFCFFIFHFGGKKNHQLKMFYTSRIGQGGWCESDGTVFHRLRLDSHQISLPYCSLAAAHSTIQNRFAIRIIYILFVYTHTHTALNGTKQFDFVQSNVNTFFIRISSLRLSGNTLSGISVFVWWQTIMHKGRPRRKLYLRTRPRLELIHRPIYIRIIIYYMYSVWM